MIRLNIPVIVEGKYDKARLSGIVDGVILPTDGFAVFNNAERRALIRRLGSRGVILLCDSDGGGHLIRSHLRGMLGGIAVYDLYTPAIRGKERRKAQASRAGILGVEGVPNDILEGIFRAFLAEHPEFDADADTSPSPDRPPRAPVTSALLYDLGLNGQPDSASRRSRAAEALGLPPGMSAKAFREAADLIADGETLRQLVREAEDSE